MKYKVSDLEGNLLDQAVAKAEGWVWNGECWCGMPTAFTVMECVSELLPNWSAAWELAGPIIERERICVSTPNIKGGSYSWWEATAAFSYHPATAGNKTAEGIGPTPLIAAMRAYVATKFGKEVYLP
jgi:hypothetical protein